MPPPEGRLSRRSFLKTGMAATTAAAVARPDGLDAAPAQDRNADPADDPFAGLRDTPTTLIMDALIRLGHDRAARAMSAKVRPMVRTGGTIVGPAVTTKYEASDTPTTRDDIREHVFRPADEAEPGSIWVTASGTGEILSMFGDVIVLACRKRGLAGLVTDGGCRDVEGMEEIGLPVYAAGTCLYGPGAAIRPVAAHVPVVCGGIEIAPGDLVAADVNGVLAFPRDALADVIRTLPALREKEDRSRRRIEEGRGLEEGYVF